VLAVTACGAVWGWGGNASQQLGLNSDCGFVAVPLQLTVTPQGLAQVCCTAVALQLWWLRLLSLLKDPEVPDSF